MVGMDGQDGALAAIADDDLAGTFQRQRFADDAGAAVLAGRQAES